MTEETFQRAKELHDEIVRLDELLTRTANLPDDSVGRICKASRTAEQLKPNIAKMIAQIEGYISVLDALLVRLNNWNRIIDNLNKNK